MGENGSENGKIDGDFRIISRYAIQNFYFMIY
jgi:hypothetical protein